ncbi:MAG TPA: TIR domain-containing protein, partial [Trichocoleus sp.]
MTLSPPEPDSKVSCDVFISYSRRDKAFVQQLWQGLQAEGFTVWVDWEDIAPLAPWRQEIHQGILAASNFLIVLSPSSLASEECQKELDCAIANNKRLVPIVHQDIDPGLAHPAIAEINWIFFRPSEDFAIALQYLVKALTTNLADVRLHARLLVQADDWEKAQQDPSFLLRGQALAAAEQLAVAATPATPALTPQQRRYIVASRQAEIDYLQRENRRQRRALGALVLGLVLVALLGLMAEVRRRAAVAQNIAALSAAAQARFAQGNTFDALLNGLQAGRELQQAPWAKRRVGPAAVAALGQAVYWVQQQNQFQGHSNWVFGVAFSPDGSRLASASLDGTARIWQIDGTPLATLGAPNGEQFWDINFSPDGQQVALATEGGEVQLWSSTGELQQRLSGHEGGVIRVRYSSDGALLASTSMDRTVRLWQRDGTFVRELTGHSAGVASASFSPDGRRLAVVTLDGILRLWQTDGTLIEDWRAHSNKAMDVRFSPDGTLLASAGADGVRLWRPDGSAAADLGGKGARAVGFSPDSQRLIVASDDGTLRLWQRDGTLMTTLTGKQTSLRAASFSPDGKYITSAGEDAAIQLWQWDPPFTQTLIGHQQTVNAVGFNSSAQQLVTAEQGGTFKIWNSEGAVIKSVTLAPEESVRVAVSPNGDLIATSSEAVPSGIGTVRLWSAAGDPIKTLGTHKSWINQLAFSSDGQSLASAGGDGLVKVWSVSGALQHTFDQGDILFGVRFDPSGDILASSGAGEIRLWNLTTGALIKTLAVDGNLYSLDFNPQGDAIAFARDRTLELWSLSETEPRPIGRHDADVAAVRFSPDGRLLISA